MQTTDLTRVIATEYGGVELHRVLVSLTGGKAYVTTEGEWRDAEREKRVPFAIGFPVEKVRRVDGKGLESQGA